MNTWIVAADESRARVLHAGDRALHSLVEIDNLVNPAGRLQDHELQTDGELRFDGHGAVGKPGAASTDGTASDREAEGAVGHSVAVFAREIGRYLEKARVEHRYDALMLVAPPKFLGALRKELREEVERLVSAELPRDVSGIDTHELATYFRAQ